MPVPDKIRLLRNDVFGEGGVLAPVAQGELIEIVAEEGARVAIRNGSSQGDYAAKSAAWLREMGFNIVEETNTDYTITTQIFVYNSTPYALKWLSETMGVASTSVYYNYDPNAGVDLVVILGDDWVGQNPIP